MKTTELSFQEINALEAMDIYGGAPTTETSLIYDLAWGIGFLIYCIKNRIIL